MLKRQTPVVRSYSAMLNVQGRTARSYNAMLNVQSPPVIGYNAMLKRQSPSVIICNRMLKSFCPVVRTYNQTGRKKNIMPQIANVRKRYSLPVENILSMSKQKNCNFGSIILLTHKIFQP